jgi:hypothetical protein
MFKIAIIITSLLGQVLDVFDDPRSEFTTYEKCQAALGKPETMQTMAALGMDFAAATGEANFTRGVCEGHEMIDSNGNTQEPK